MKLFHVYQIDAIKSSVNNKDLIQKGASKCVFFLNCHVVSIKINEESWNLV